MELPSYHRVMHVDDPKTPSRPLERVENNNIPQKGILDAHHASVPGIRYLGRL